MLKLETEVEKKRIGKAKVGLVTLSVLAVILASLNIWSYSDLQKQKNTINDLQVEKNALLIEKDALLIEKDTLQHQLSLLNITYLDYVSTHVHNNTEYDNYVTNHQHTNSEHALLQAQYDFHVTYYVHTQAQYDEAFFFFYYVEPEEQKFGVYNLDSDLYGLNWSEPYQEDVFDCSEMSACLEWYLENRGWHVRIASGDAPFGGGYHAWLLVETSLGHYMPVESTTLEIVWWDDPYFDNYFVYDRELEDIHGAIAYLKYEFDWWKLGYCPLDFS